MIHARHVHHCYVVLWTQKKILQQQQQRYSLYLYLGEACICCTDIHIRKAKEKKDAIHLMFVLQITWWSNSLAILFFAYSMYRHMYMRACLCIFFNQKKKINKKWINFCAHELVNFFSSFKKIMLIEYAAK